MEQRQSERAKICRKLALEWSSDGEGPFEETALSRDLSLNGVCVNARRAFEPGQHVCVRIPTDGCPAAWKLPSELRAEAEVKRVLDAPGGTRQIALAFQPCLTQRMEFGFFMAYLLGRTSAQRHIFA